MVNNECVRLDHLRCCYFSNHSPNSSYVEEKIMKECNTCNEVKELSSYVWLKERDTHRDICKPCYNLKTYKYQREKYTKEERQLRNRKSKLMTCYGMTIEDYDKMYSAQEGKCGICEEHQPTTGLNMSIDHDHAYPKGVKEAVRGLLCCKCNQAIGLLQDSSSVVLRAVNYLKAHDK